MEKSTLEFYIEIVTALCGIVVFFRGISEYRANTKIKRAEFLDMLIKEFLDPEIDIAKSLLDDFVYVKKEDRNKSPIEQKQIAKSLSLYLRDHSIEPIGVEDEIVVRKSFDKLLDFFTRLSYYLKQKLISPSELSYFRYFLDKIENKPEVISYIKRYYYLEDFTLLLNNYKIQS